MESLINKNYDEEERRLRAIQYYSALIGFLYLMFATFSNRKNIGIIFFCSLLFLNYNYEFIPFLPPFSPNSPPYPPSNLDFNSTPIIPIPPWKSPIPIHLPISPIYPPNPAFIVVSPWIEIIQEMTLSLSKDDIVDSLKKADTQILYLLNHQDLSRKQKNALKKCQNMAQRSVKLLQKANGEIIKAHHDFDSVSDSFFLDYETACTRFKSIIKFLLLAEKVQGSCLQKLGRRSERQSLFESFNLDSMTPISSNLVASREKAQAIEVHCSHMLNVVKPSKYVDAEEKEEYQEYSSEL